MKNLKLIVQYDGTNFFGWQKQEGKRTVQETLEQVLSQLLKENIEIEASGRTDKGVHAEMQTCSFKSNNTSFQFSRLQLPANILLPNDVSVISCEETNENFHARYDAKRKTYKYDFFVSRVKMPLKERYALRIPNPVNFLIMQKTASVFEGTHDFSSFCVSRSKKESCERTIYFCKLIKKEENIFSLTICGNGFLHNMVRIIAGTIVDCGNGKLKMEDVYKMFEIKNRTCAGKTLPSNGLTLLNVEYN